jgi:hypothetical protein
MRHPAPSLSFGTPGGDRTHGLRFRKPPLYPLSYGRIKDLQGRTILCGVLYGVVPAVMREL